MQNPKACRICSKEFEPRQPLQVVCGIACARKVTVVARKKERADRREDRRKREAMKPRKKLAKEAEAAVNKYVRLRDARLGCVSCDKPASWSGQWHASHFRSVGAASAVRFHLWNIHKACSVCNKHLSGNLAEYEPRLRSRIGSEKVDWLRTQNQIVRYEADYLRRLKAVMTKKASRVDRPPCSAAGCDRVSMYVKVALCQKHYFRKMRNGTTELLPPVVPKKETETPNGYLTVHAPKHPAGNGNSRVFAHRVVAYEKYGAGPFLCAMCTSPINWKTLHVDHIDENKKNNDPSNLRLTCRGCNTTRTPRSTTPQYSHNGKTQSLTAWAKEPGVQVGRHQAASRLKKGWSLSDALYKPNKTHPRAKGHESTVPSPGTGMESSE